MGATMIEALRMSLGIRQRRRAALRQFLLSRKAVLRQVLEDEGVRYVNTSAPWVSPTGRRGSAPDENDIDAPKTARPARPSRDARAGVPAQVTVELGVGTEPPDRIEVEVQLRCR